MTTANEAVATAAKEATNALTQLASQGSVGSGSKRGAPRPTPKPSTQNARERILGETNPTLSLSRAKRAKSKAPQMEDSGIASALTTVPHDKNPGEDKVDYTESPMNFQNF